MLGKWSWNRRARAGRVDRARRSSATLLTVVSALAVLLALPSWVQAQNLISVPFTNGFIGTRGSSAGTANSVRTFATLGISRVFFIQNSSTNQFELQGNDIPGTLRIVRTSGITIDMPASANWRNSGGTTYLVGILPRPTSAITLTYSGGSIQITDGSVSGGTSVGGYVASYTGTTLADGASTSGNAAQSQVLGGLNDYLTTVVSSRPAGPVTVTAQTTTSTTPTIAGTATLVSGEALSVVVAGVQYTTSSTPAIAQSGTSWSLTLTSPLALGTYSVTATITNADGFTLSDATSNELTIWNGSSPAPLTISGSFTASDRTYDGTTAATGTTGSLTLGGVLSPDQVSIASATFQFVSAAAGNGKSVTITSVTLGGADAARYTVSLTGAPTAMATIAPKALTIGGSFTAADKTYDGTATATIATNALTLTGVVGVDAVALAGVTAAFADATIGSTKPVALTTATLTGAAAANYTLGMTGAPTTTASITAGAAPSAPTNVAATPGDGSLVATWSAPATIGCGAITGYILEYSTDQGSHWTRAAVIAASSSTTTLMGLTDNVAYLVHMAATNSCGTGTFSSTVGPVIPVGPTVNGSTPVATAPGTASGTTGGVTQAITIDVVQDTMVHLTSGSVSLRLSALDQLGAGIPVDSTHTVAIDQGGSAAVGGSGFAPGTYASTYLIPASGTPTLLGMTLVAPDGSFAAIDPVSALLPAGSYTLQVKGIDASSTARALQMGVQVGPPPPTLTLAAVPDQASPAAGDTITITLTVTNKGTGPAIDVVIPRAFQEPGFVVVRASPVQGSYDATTHTWTIDRIESGAQARMLVTAVVTPPATSPSTAPASARAPATSTKPVSTP